MSVSQRYLIATCGSPSHFGIYLQNRKPTTPNLLTFSSTIFYWQIGDQYIYKRFFFVKQNARDITNGKIDILHITLQLLCKATLNSLTCLIIFSTWISIVRLKFHSDPTITSEIVADLAIPYFNLPWSPKMSINLPNALGNISDSDSLPINNVESFIKYNTIVSWVIYLIKSIQHFSLLIVST